MQASKLLSPVHGAKRSTSSMEQDISISNNLKVSAMKKFDQGFSASFSGHPQSRPETPNVDARREETEDARPHRPFLPARCNSVLGLRSDERKVDGTLRNCEAENEQPALDYVDLEALLQEKMKEINSQMPRAKNGRKSRRASEIKSLDEDQELEDGTEYNVDSNDYAKRVKEASYLFKLCQKEIMLQIKIHCPERARLCEKSLDFFSTVLECLVQPLEQYKTDVTALRQWRDDEQQFQAALLADLQQWSGAQELLSSAGWQRAGNQGAPQQLKEFVQRGAAASFRQCAEALAAAVPAAVQSMALLQADKEEMEQGWVPKAELEAAVRAREAAEAALAGEKRKAVEGAVEFNAAKRALEDALAASEKEGVGLKAAKAALEKQAEGLEAEAKGLRERTAAAEAERKRMEGELQKAKEELGGLQEEVERRGRELGEVRERLRQLTEQEIQLTPRPTWAGREIGGAGSTTQDRVRKAVEEWGKADERVRSLEVVAAEVEELRGSKAQLDQLLSVKKIDSACGCPEKRPGVEEVDVEEYLTNYLCKRFGLQGVSSAWEVERMTKDFGWVMQAKVGMRAGEI